MFCYGPLSVILFVPVFVLIWNFFEGEVHNMAVDWLGNIKFYVIVGGIVITISAAKFLFHTWKRIEYPTIIDKVIKSAKEYEKI